MTIIFHITSRNAALLARQSGEYRAESLASEGFIHFSASYQLLGVANRFYAGLHGQVILAVDTSRLTASLKYEAPAHPKNEGFTAEERLKDETFPHLYGPLNFAAVIGIYDFEPEANGQFASLPSALLMATQPNSTGI